jgi:hypothetical protein
MRGTQRLIAVVLLAGVAGVARGSQEHVVSYGQTRERIAGLLEMPEILGDFDCKDFQARSVSFYPEPSKDRAATGMIEVRPYRNPDTPDCYLPKVTVHRSGANAAAEELPTDEIGYEMQAAVVYERRDTWFRIALLQDSAWIERDDNVNFLSYPASLTSDTYLTYLRQDWDGRLWTAPGAAAAVAAPQGWQAYRAKSLPVRVLSTRTVGQEIWIQIRFETGDVCGETLEGVTPLEGWIPAYRQTMTSVWFYSRGC